MANGFDPIPGARPSPATTFGRGSVAVDAGLRAYMLSVYNYMASGVLLTGIVALLFARSGAVTSMFNPVTGHMSGLGWIIVLAPLALVMILSYGINRLSTGAAQALYWIYATVMGLSLSTIFIVYTGTSIALTFFAAAAAFLSLSLWGYATKKDLTGWGSFLLMGVIGLIVALMINVFWGNSTFDLAISAIGVLLFAGLTAYDTQKLKSMYFAGAGDRFSGISAAGGLVADRGDRAAYVGKLAIMGALTLYLDFINLFLFLLRFMGDRR